jgi:hypothetical protein
MRKRYRSVELLGVPNYYQGSHDSLCVYYTAAMLLTTLHPTYQDLLGRGARRQRVGLKVEDPLIKNYPGSQKIPKDQVLSSWFYGGARLKDACALLKATMKEDCLDTKFKHKSSYHVQSTYDLIADHIDDGLPVMIGWNTVDFGVHCALVIGYRIAARQWLVLHDPTCGNDEICWEVLKEIDRSRLELINVEYHDGPRSDRITVDKKGRKQIDRWWPCEGRIGYHPVDELYKTAKRASGLPE